MIFLYVLFQLITSEEHQCNDGYGYDPSKHECIFCPEGQGILESGECGYCDNYQGIAHTTGKCGSCEEDECIHPNGHCVKQSIYNVTKDNDTKKCKSNL